MFEKEAKERAKDYTSNKERQVAYECGFLDGADKATEEKAKWEVKFNDSNRNWNELVTDWVKDLEREVTELKEKLAGAERTRDNLRQLGFPTFQSCKEYADKMHYAKAIIKDLLDNSDEYAKQRAIDFLKEI
jgi:hypothetical protein